MTTTAIVHSVDHRVERRLADAYTDPSLVQQCWRVLDEAGHALGTVWQADHHRFPGQFYVDVVTYGVADLDDVVDLDLADSVQAGIDAVLDWWGERL